MKIYVEQGKVKRRVYFARAASLGGLLILLGAITFSFSFPSLTILTIVFSLLGVAVWAAGMYTANRWIKKPRPEDTLDHALKSLSDQHRMYHYLPVCDHLLLAPGGLFVLSTVNLGGHFSYANGKWSQRLLLNRALRFIFEGRLGDPVGRAQNDCQKVTRNLKKELPGMGTIPVLPVVIFVHPAAELEVENPPIPVCLPKNLARVVLKKSANLPPELYRQIQEALDRDARISPYR